MCDVISLTGQPIPSGDTDTSYDAWDIVNSLMADRRLDNDPVFRRAMAKWMRTAADVLDDLPTAIAVK